MNKKAYVFWVILALVGLGIIGFFLLQTSQIGPGGDNRGNVSQNGLDMETKVPDGETPQSQIKVPKPNLTKIPQFNTKLTDFDKGNVIKDVKDFSGHLSNHPDDIDVWLDLGVRFKAAGDYEGAREIWEYAAALKPKQSIAFSNLGLLYGYYLHDDTKAEANLLQAIKNDSKIGYYYLNMADFYLDSLKNKEKAIDILKKGLVMLPSDQSLKASLDSIR